MSLLNKSSIFDGADQFISHDPKDVRPIYDRVLVREIPEPETRGSIFIPQSALGKPGLRIGEVVAVGKGDRWIEKGWREGESEPRRSALKVDRLPMDVKPGDRVVYDRRTECEVYLQGEPYSLIHQEQSIFCVLE